MKNKLKKILLLISDLDELRDITEKAAAEINPAQTVILATKESKNQVETSFEFRLLQENSKENIILATIREFTDIYDAELVCCVAGNTELGLIVTNAMSLTARYLDKLYHIQTEPFKINDIPFTRLCYLYRDQFNRLPENYADTVELANLRVSRHIDAPDLFLSADPYRCMIGEFELPLEPDEFMLLWLLATRCKNEVIPIHGEAELLDEYRAFMDSTLSTVMPEISEIPEQLIKETESDIQELVKSLTLKIKQHIAFDNGRDCALPQRDQGIYSLAFPPENIMCPRNY